MNEINNYKSVLLNTMCKDVTCDNSIVRIKLCGADILLIIKVDIN